MNQRVSKEAYKKRNICMPLRVERYTCRISKGTTVNEKRSTKETYMCAKEPLCIEKGLQKRNIYVYASDSGALLHVGFTKRQPEVKNNL